MSVMSDFRKNCIFYAKRLGDYQKISITDLANGYCDAIDNDDAKMKDSYIGALTLRWWYVLDKLYQSSLTLNLEREEFIAWLFEAFEYAAKYRAWQDPEKHTTAQACINKCISTIRLQHFYQANLHIHKAAYETVSLETPINDDGTDTIGDTLQDEDTIDKNLDMAHDTIQAFINKNKIIEAIILDNIAYKDVFKHSKKTVQGILTDGTKTRATNYYTEFWPYKLIQEIDQLNSESYKNYFTTKYIISDNKFNVAFDALCKANNQKKYRILRSTLEYAKSVVSY